VTTETNSTALKWYNPHRLGMTKEYCGRIIAGFGLGVMLLAYAMNLRLIPPYWNMMMIFGLIFMAVGVSIARHAQRQRALNNNGDNN
jgi:hypothetical protein